MIRISLSCEIDQPVDAVFAYAVDRANLARWFPGVVAAEPAGALNVGSTTTIHTRMFGMPYTVRAVVEQYEPGRRFAVRVDGLLKGDEDERFIVTTRGTRIEYAGVFRLAGIVRVGEPILAWFVRRTLERAYAQLKNQLEARAC